MAPALRMTRSIKETLTFFLRIFWLHFALRKVSDSNTQGDGSTDLLSALFFAANAGALTMDKRHEGSSSVHPRLWCLVIDFEKLLISRSVALWLLFVAAFPAHRWLRLAVGPGAPRGHAIFERRFSNQYNDSTEKDLLPQGDSSVPKLEPRRNQSAGPVFQKSRGRI